MQVSKAAENKLTGGVNNVRYKVVLRISIVRTKINCFVSWVPRIAKVDFSAPVESQKSTMKRGFRGITCWTRIDLRKESRFSTRRLWSRSTNTLNPTCFALLRNNTRTCALFALKLICLFQGPQSSQCRPQRSIASAADPGSSTKTNYRPGKEAKPRHLRVLRSGS